MKPLMCAVLLLAAVGTAAAQPKVDQEIIALTRAYFEANAAGDPAAVEKLVAKDFLRVEMQRFADRSRASEAATIRAKSGIKGTITSFWGERVQTLPNGTAIYIGGVNGVTRSPKADVKPVEWERWVSAVWIKEGAAWKLAHVHLELAGPDFDRQRWNETYQSARITGLINLEPNKFLMQSVRGRKPGAALDVGMGQGRNALFLASQGWKVTGIDISDEGIREATETAKAQGLTLDAQVVDADKWDWGKDRWDLIALVYMGGQQWAGKVKTALKPGGIIVIEYFHADHAASRGMGGYKTGELPALYKGWKILKYEEVVDVADWGKQKVKLVRFAAQKP